MPWFAPNYMHNIFLLCQRKSTLQFYLFPDSHNNRNVSAILKLLNINAFASLHPNYAGPSINVMEDPLLRDVRCAQRKDKEIFVQRAMDDFSKLACPPSFLLPNVNTMMGFEIEGEVVFDKNAKPLSIGGISIFGGRSPGSEPEITIPEDATR